MTDPEQSSHDHHDNADEEGQLANPGPVPATPEESADTGEEPGDLAPQAAPDRSD